jgi:hypothetical protein
MKEDKTWHHCDSHKDNNYDLPIPVLCYATRDVNSGTKEWFYQHLVSSGQDRQGSGSIAEAAFRTQGPDTCWFLLWALSSAPGPWTKLSNPGAEKGGVSLLKELNLEKHMLY